jgi:hypothetical protein
MSFNNNEFNRTCLLQIRDILKLPPQASHADLVARVRELKAVEDLSLAVHQRAKTHPAATAEQDDDDLPIGPRRSTSSTDH